MKAKFAYVLLLTMMIFLLFGCISEEKFNAIKKERIAEKNEYDIDNDGVWDYAIYYFQPVDIDSQSKMQRVVAVANIQKAKYTNYKKLSDLYIQEIDVKLADFFVEKNQENQACAKKLGIREGKCITPTTCVNLCSLGSEKCKETASEYPEIIGGAILSYQNKMNDIDSYLANSKTILPQLVRDESGERKAAFLDDIFEMKNSIATANINPLVFYESTSLCERTNYGAEKLAQAAASVGDYQVESQGYQYAVAIKIESKDKGQQPVSVLVEDKIPFSISNDEIDAYQNIIKTKESGGTKIKFTQSSIKSQPYVFVYFFTTEKTPEEYADSLNVGTAKITYADLTALAMVNSIFLDVASATGSHYFAGGVVVGLILSLVMLIYTIFILLFEGVKSAINKTKVSEGIMKKLSKTPMRWKFSIASGVIVLLIAFVLNAYLLAEPFTITNIMDIAKFDFENANTMAGQLIGFMLAATGVVLVYDGLENFVKITAVDRFYGAARRARRQDYIGQIAQLKEYLQQLKVAVEKANGLGLDTQEEYTTLASLQTQRISALERKMTPENAVVLAENLDKVEAALSSLEEKMKAVEENWPKWRAYIESELSEKNELNSAGLTEIPQNLRSWALAKYAKEHPADEIIFEKDVLKRKKITAPMLIREFARKNLLKSAIFIQNENIIASYCGEEKSATTLSVLTLRLRAYLYSLGKAFGGGVPDSFVSVGDSSVLVISKIGRYETVLILPREKFKEAYEQIKEKVKLMSD